MIPLLPFDMQGLVVISGSQRDIVQHRRNLTIVHYDIGEQEKVRIHAYLNILPTKIGVPRAYALQGYANVADFEVCGQDFECGPPRKNPDLRPRQIAPVEELVKGFEIHYDQMLQSPTGSGKTVMGCEIASRLGKCTLILVDQDILLQQWIDTLQDHFGYFLEEIGIVGGGVCDYILKDFTIGMIQSIYNREFKDDFYSQFGFVIYDEYHVCGADQYSAVLSMFPAENRLAMSAVERKDSKQKIIEFHLNQNKVVVEDERRPSQMRYVEYDGDLPSWYAQISPKDGRYISELSNDPVRNELIVRVIMKLHAMGRKLLVIGARINQLEGLREMCIALGVVEESTVLYTGKESIWKWRKDKTPDRPPEGWIEQEEDEDLIEYTPVQFVLHEKKVNLKKRNPQLESCQIIFSTYSVFSKGVDVPDLDAGIDVTPKTGFVNIHGRVLRQVVGKLMPIWATIRDINSFRAEYQFEKRVGEFVKSNAEIYLWHLDKGIKPLPASKVRAGARKRVKWLKERRVLTGGGGENIVVMQHTGK